MPEIAPITFFVSNETDPLNTTSGGGGIGGLNSVIAAIDLGGSDAQPGANYVINITGQINLTTDLLAINLAPGSSLTIEGTDGSGAAAVQTIDGGGTERGFFVLSGQ